MKTVEKIRVLLSSVLGMMVTVGIARFAYTPMIPEMTQGIGLSESVAGYLASANYAGYLIGALLISRLQNIRLKVMLYQLGLAGAVITTVAMAYTTQEWLWYVLRFLAGLSSAAGVLLGAGLLMLWLLRHQQKPELGVFFSGLGLGIALTALISEVISTRFTWDEQWQIYAAAGLFLLIPVRLWMPDFHTSAMTAKSASAPVRRHPQFMLTLQMAYFCAGAGYVVSATFLVAIARSTPSLADSSNGLWLVVGLSAALGCWLWDLYVRRVGDWPALLLAYVLNGLSVLMLLIGDDFWLVMLSAIIYGASFIGIVSMMLALVGRLYPANPSRPMSHLTFSYGLAQMIAPAITGYLAEQQGDYQQGLLLTAVVMGVGTVLLLMAMRLQQKTAREADCYPDPERAV
ncbi:MAG: YbfB/YjiJ family MFS transporter [Oceanobacter sp.]